MSAYENGDMDQKTLCTLMLLYSEVNICSRANQFYVYGAKLEFTMGETKIKNKAIK